MSTLLHPEYLDHPALNWRGIADNLNTRAEAVFREQAALARESEGLSVVIRTRNDGEYMPGLMEDILRCEVVYQKPVEVIVVDTESSDRTLSIARSFGATVCGIEQADFTYPKALNMGFEAASFSRVLTLVGHSALSNTATFLAADLLASKESYGGLYGWTLPNRNVTRSEKWATAVSAIPGSIARGAKEVDSPGLGSLAANCSIVSRDLWQAVGGYNEAFAAGGEDGELMRRGLQEGYRFGTEPALSVHHTHGLGPLKLLRQLRNWMTMANPRPFNPEELAKFRPDLQLPDRNA
jgi:hypothetical protein